METGRLYCERSYLKVWSFKTVQSFRVPQFIRVCVLVHAVAYLHDTMMYQEFAYSFILRVIPSKILLNIRYLWATPEFRLPIQAALTSVRNFRLQVLYLDDQDARICEPFQVIQAILISVNELPPADAPPPWSMLKGFKKRSDSPGKNSQLMKL